MKHVNISIWSNDTTISKYVCTILQFSIEFVQCIFTYFALVLLFICYYECMTGKHTFSLHSRLFHLFTEDKNGKKIVQEKTLEKLFIYNWQCQRLLGKHILGSWSRTHTHDSQDIMTYLFVFLGQALWISNTL